MSEKRLKAIEEELAYLGKTISEIITVTGNLINEIKDIRKTEIHTHYTNQYLGYPEDYSKDEQ